MKYDLNTHASASAIGKILGVAYTEVKELKEVLEQSGLTTVDKSYVAKNKTVNYKAYAIIEAVRYCLENVEGSHIQELSIEINE